MGDRALTPPTRHRLGRPLPHQQADRTQAPLSVGSYALSSCELMRNYPGFRRAIPRQKVDSYVLLTRLPLSLRTIRLACLRHAASVHPEPGSNSQIKKLFLPLLELTQKIKAANVKEQKSKKIPRPAGIISTPSVGTHFIRAL